MDTVSTKTKRHLAVAIHAARDVIGDEMPSSISHECDIDVHNWIEAYRANPSRETAIGLAFRTYEYFGGLMEMRGHVFDPEDDSPSDRKGRLASRAALVDLGLLRPPEKVIKASTKGKLRKPKAKK